MILFVCAANVGRSQIAEGVAKKFGIKAISCAAVEARKEKYNGKPDKDITRILLEKYNISISSQKISYPKDIKNQILKSDKIVFLFDPNNVNEVDKEVLINNMPLWVFLEKLGKKYEILPIKDPYKEDENFKEKIIDQIYNLIKLRYVRKL